MKNGYCLLYHFLIEKEKIGYMFSLDDISFTTGMKKNTILKYIKHPNINHYFEIKNLDNRTQMYKTNGLLNISEIQFKNKLSQGSKKLNETESLTIKLSEKSFDSFISALELYNKLTLKNKTEAFCILMVNAWELLLKSILIKKYNNKKIIYNNEKTITIMEAVNLFYGQKNNAVKHNLINMIDLRNDAMHLLIEEIRCSLSKLFQANIINYLELRNKYNIETNIDNSSGMLSLIIPGDNNIKEIEQHYGFFTKKKNRRIFKKT